MLWRTRTRVEWAAKTACLHGIILTLHPGPDGAKFRWRMLTEENMELVEAKMAADPGILLIGCYEPKRGMGEPELREAIAEDLLDAGFR